MKSLKNIFEKYYLKVIRDNYSNFSGRASRKEFWMFVFFIPLIGGILLLIFLCKKDIVMKINME